MVSTQNFHIDASLALTLNKKDALTLRISFTLLPCWWWGTSCTPPGRHQAAGLSPPLPLSTPCARRPCRWRLSSHRGNTPPRRRSSAADMHEPVKSWVIQQRHHSPGGVTSVDRTVISVYSRPLLTNSGISTDALGSDGKYENLSPMSNCFKTAVVASLLCMVGSRRLQKAAALARAFSKFQLNPKYSRVKTVKTGRSRSCPEFTSQGETLTLRTKLRLILATHQVCQAMSLTALRSG